MVDENRYHWYDGADDTWPRYLPLYRSLQFLVGSPAVLIASMNTYLRTTIDTRIRLYTHSLGVNDNVVVTSWLYKFKHIILSFPFSSSFSLSFLFLSSRFYFSLATNVNVAHESTNNDQIIATSPNVYCGYTPIDRCVCRYTSTIRKYLRQT